MGILSSIESGLQKFGKAVGSVYSATLAKVPGVEKIKSFVENNPEVAVGGLGLAKVGTSIGGKALVQGAATTIPSVLKAVVPTTAKGKVVAGVLALPAATAIVKNPTIISQGVSSAFNVEKNLIKTAANPSIANIKETITENPILLGGAALIGAGSLVSKIAPAVATARQTEAIQEQTEVLKAATEKDIPFSIQEISPKAPTTPQTAVIQPTSKVSTKRKKRSTKALMPSINQNVSVIVQNKNNNVGIKATKKYLNANILRN